MSSQGGLKDIEVFVRETRFDELLIPIYADRQRPAEFRLFAYSVYLRGGDRYLRLTQVDQGDQLAMDIVNVVEYDSSLVDDGDVINGTVDVTSQYLGDITSFGVSRSVAYLTERSDLAAGRVAALAMTTDRGELLFDPLTPLGVRIIGGPMLPDLSIRYTEMRTPVGVTRWFPADLADLP